MDYSILSERIINEEHTSALEGAIKSEIVAVSAISVYHYTSPQVVVAHCGDNTLEQSQIKRIKDVVDSFDLN